MLNSSTSQHGIKPTNLSLQKQYCFCVRAAISDWLCTLQTDKDKLNDSYAALERKAVLYDRLSQGRFEDDEEQYNVDFLQKGFLTDEMRHSRHRPAHDPAEPVDTSAMAIRASGVQLKLSLLQTCFSPSNVLCQNAQVPDGQILLVAQCHVQCGAVQLMPACILYAKS